VVRWNERCGQLFFSFFDLSLKRKSEKKSCAFHIIFISLKYTYKYLFLINIIICYNIIVIILLQKKYIYTGWPILIHPVEYLENQAREKKMFRTKVVWFRGGHKMVPLVRPWRVIWRSREGHLNFFKWHSLFLLHILVADLECFSKHYN